MLQRLTTSIYYLPFESETNRPILFYIRGKKESVAIDAGNSTAHVQKFYQALKEENLPLPSKTIITHWHWDHTFGLSSIHGKSYGTRKTYEKLEQVKHWEWNEEAMKERERTGEDIAFCNQCIRLEYGDLSQIRVVNLDEIIDSETHWDIGGVELVLYPRDSTHTRDSLFIHIPSEECLIVADADWVDSYDNHDKYDAQRLESMISFFEQLDYEKHLISHGLWLNKQEALLELKNLPSDRITY